MSAAVAIGVMGSLGPLCSQAFAAGQYKRVSAWLQVSVVWPVLVFVPPLVAAWLFSGTLLRLANVGSSERVSALADEFGRWSLLWVAPAMVFNGLSLWLESMDIVWPTTILTVAFVAVNAALNWVFVGGMDGVVSSWHGFGLIGSPIATAVGKVLLLATLWVWAFVFTSSYRPHRAWKGWSCSSLCDRRLVFTFLRLGMPLAVNEAVFDWSFEILTAFGGMWQPEDAATMGVLINLMFMFQALQMGLLSAVSMHVRRCVVDGDGEAAADIARQGTLWTFCIAIVSGTLLWLFSPWLGPIFSTDKSVQDAVLAAAPIVAGTVTVSSMSAATQGVLDGLGRYDLVACAALGGSWFVGLPLAWALGQGAGGGLPGLWLGVMGGEAVKSVLLALMASRVKWHVEVVKAARNVHRETEAVLAIEERLGGAGLDEGDPVDDLDDFDISELA